MHFNDYLEKQVIVFDKTVNQVKGTLLEIREYGVLLDTPCGYSFFPYGAISEIRLLEKNDK